MTTADDGRAHGIMEEESPDSHLGPFTWQSHSIPGNGIAGTNNYMPRYTSTRMPPIALEVERDNIPGKQSDRVDDEEGESVLVTNLDQLHVDTSNNASSFKPARITLKPSDFHGGKEDPISYLDSFNLISKSNHWSDQIKADLFPSFLKSTALAWYMQKTDEREREGKGAWDWSTLQDEFINSSGPIETRKNLIEIQLWNRRQKEQESCLEFAIAIENLSSRLDKNMVDKRRIQNVIRGLIDKNREIVLPHNPQKMSELMSILSKIDEATLWKARLDDTQTEIILFQTGGRNDRRPILRPTSPLHNAFSSPQFTQNKGNNDFKAGRNNFPRYRGNGRQRVTFSANTAGKESDKGRSWNNSSSTSFNQCYNCGDTGHFRRQCPLLRNLNYQQEFHNRSPGRSPK